ncbi:hypothetical protein HD806DRAFT_60614 [Xylariaceae sp. AK1471]|nr:hypothetical protein HD806DRAFT_60614 [Xylariaceae sp. AK1471]
MALMDTITGWIRRSAGNDGNTLVDITESPSLPLEAIDDTTRNWPQTSKKRVPFLLSRLKPWRFQLSALLVSLASFISLGTVALVYSGRPLSAWSSNIISINGVVSALTTVMKTSLMVSVSDAIGQAKWSWFSPQRQSPKKLGRPLNDLEGLDAASRGTWGSLIWLFKHPLHPHFVSIGAVLTILAAPLDVSSQQLISVSERLVEDTYARAYMPWAANNFALDDRIWTAAVFEGLFKPKVEDLSVHCPGEYCIWDTIPSLGACGKCSNINDELPGDWMSCSGPFCNYSLPVHDRDEMPPPPHVINAPRANSTWWDIKDYITAIPANIPIGSEIAYKIPLSILIPYTTGSSRAFPDDEPIREGFFTPTAMSLERFYVIHTRESESRIYSEPTVTRCGFWHCMQAFRTSVVAGKLNQSVLRRKNQVYSRDTSYGGTFHDIPSFNMQGRRFQATKRSHRIHQDTILSQDTKEIHVAKVMTEFHGEVFTVSGTSNPFFVMWDDVMDDLDAWVDRVSKSMTNAIRQSYRPDDNDVAYVGKVFKKYAYIHVSWPWIAYPFLILTFSLIFFAVSVVTTVQHEENIWGNSSLILALSVIDANVGKDIQGPRVTKKELERHIGEYRVSFEWTPAGWAFKKL